MRSLNSLTTGWAASLRKNAHPMKTTRLIASLLLSVSLLSACAGQQNAVSSADRDAVAAMSKAGKAYFEEKCKTVAGEKIYRTVSDVEGVLLMKLRPARGDRELADPLWPGAAFAFEFRDQEYIKSFLWFEHSSSPTKEAVSINNRGYLNETFSNVPGYRYVDVLDAKSGVRHRYTGSNKVTGRKDVSAFNVQLALKADPNYDLNVYQWALDKIPAPDPSPRYGVTFEDHVVPEDRAMGVASSTVTVLDFQTNEVLGETTRYAWRAHGPTRSSPTPWLNAITCPLTQGGFARTRQFVDQILIPKKD